eukprot:scaffold1880_cov115-Isochrysis_galbana.AAC.11
MQACVAVATLPHGRNGKGLGGGRRTRRDWLPTGGRIDDKCADDTRVAAGCGLHLWRGRPGALPPCLFRADSFQRCDAVFSSGRVGCQSWVACGLGVWCVGVAAGDRGRVHVRVVRSLVSVAVARVACVFRSGARSPGRQPAARRAGKLCVIFDI